MTTAWKQLGDELDRWAGAGRVATLWWRDDDAAQPTESLSRALDLRSRADIPLALAAIPATIEESVAVRLRDNDDIDVLQHGYAHRNHARPGESKVELGAQRPADAVLDELGLGGRRLEAMVGARFLGVLVPPWNRIDETLVGRLGGAGFTGISTYGPRNAAHAAPSLMQVNAHVDIIDWRATRRFVGDEAALAMAVGHLRARRAGEADGDEPTGLLSHHLVHDEAAWRFIDAYVEATKAHPAVRWVSARQAFAAGAQ
jgi:hypothetical protein